MLANLRELWRFRELLLTMVEREIKIRYKNSVFGFLWSLLNPLVTVLVLTLVFKYLNGNPTPNFSAYILAAYLPFMFFQFAIMDSAQSVLAALPVIRKVYFPREILPLAAICSNFIHFLLALVVLFAYFLFIWIRHPQVTPFTESVIWLPVLIVIQFALTVGVGFIVSALNTFYEDTKYIVGVALYLLFFLSPILYFSENVRYAFPSDPEKENIVYVAYHLNPVAMLSTAYRKVLVPPQDVYVNGQWVPPLPLSWTLLGITALVSFGVLAFGYWAFNRVKWRFVERP